MYNLLLKLVLAATLFQFGLSLTDFANCRDQKSCQKLEAARNQILKIQWRPISLFPEEARKFQ